MRIHVGHVLAVVSLLAMSAPAWAKTESTNITIVHAANVEGTMLQPGSYRVVASDDAKDTNNVKFMQNDKVVAEVPAQWTKLDHKSQYSEVLTDSGKVSEINFAGKEMALKFKS